MTGHTGKKLGVLSGMTADVQDHRFGTDVTGQKRPHPLVVLFGGRLEGMGHIGGFGSPSKIAKTETCYI
jgi:hypothetical protein